MHADNVLCINVAVAYLLQLVFFYEQISRNLGVLHNITEQLQLNVMETWKLWLKEIISIFQLKQFDSSV